jgi:hypothetical protein
MSAKRNTGRNLTPLKPKFLIERMSAKIKQTQNVCPPKRHKTKSQTLNQPKTNKLQPLIRY